MHKNTYFRAEANKETELQRGVLRGIVRVNNTLELSKWNDNEFEVNFSAARHLNDSYRVRVTYDTKGVLRLTRKDMSLSKSYFRHLNYELSYEDKSFDSVSDVYASPSWKVVEKCVAMHKAEREKNGIQNSTYDIFRVPGEADFTISFVPVEGNTNKQKVEIRLDKEFLFEENAVKFRVTLFVEDLERGLKFKSSFLVRSNKHVPIHADDWATDITLRQLAHICISALQGAVLGALKSEDLHFVMEGNYRNNLEIDPICYNATLSYEKVRLHCVELLHLL